MKEWADRGDVIKMQTQSVKFCNLSNLKQLKRGRLASHRGQIIRVYLVKKQ